MRRRLQPHPHPLLLPGALQQVMTDLQQLRCSVRVQSTLLRPLLLHRRLLAEMQAGRPGRPQQQQQQRRRRRHCRLMLQWGRW